MLKSILSVNHLIAGPEPAVPEDLVVPNAAIEEQARPQPAPTSTSVAAPATAPLLLPVADAGPSENRGESSHNLHGSAESSGEQSKAEEFVNPPIARQSSIFKLLSPSAPSFGSQAPPSLADPDSFPFTSQDAQAEVEAMI